MKWIAVPTDFTVTSANAVTYAAELAYFLGAKLLVFHVADRPNFTPTFGEDAEKPDEVEQESMAMLKTIANKLTDRFKGRLDFETALQWGREEETAQRLIDEFSPDLLVIGIRNDNFLTSTWDDHGMAYELDCN
ncbi:MAG TPA: universal stress protein, partial [Luteibaculaceae bacterium]|nr:universal stress protein [Luteibaculaceae bacterium]